MTTELSGRQPIVSEREKTVFVNLLERDMQLYSFRLRLEGVFTNAPDMEFFKGDVDELSVVDAIMSRVCEMLPNEAYEECRYKFWEKTADMCLSMGKELHEPVSRRKAATDLVEYALTEDWSRPASNVVDLRPESRFIKQNIAKFLLSTSFLFVLGACSFKSPENKRKSSRTVINHETVVTDPKDDSDGDKVLDGVEVERGTNPLLADLPEIQVRFLQNYDISFFHTNETESTWSAGDFVISSHTRSTDADFRYRVGEVMLRDRSFKSAAEIGKFQSHSWGAITRQDLSWVRYPDVDPVNYHYEAMRARALFSVGEIEDLKIRFENTFKLLPTSVYKEIKNLKLAFRFYDYEKESYELLHEVTIERVLQAGVAEKVEVIIENPPRKLIEDNYLKKGEFILSEVVDYEIPELGTTYQTLMNSVRAKSLPVLVTTPLETRIEWVGLPGGSASFQQVLSRVFGGKFTIEENNLVKVEQFENNLPSYEHLSEVKDKDKHGKWFVFTDRLLKHYLDHRYTTKDVISLSYVTGKELSSQADERVYTYIEEATGNQDFEMYPLGNITPNSEISLQLEGARRWGDGLESFTEQFHSNNRSCNNCTNVVTQCTWEINKFTERNEGFVLKKDFTGELEHISLVINRTEYPLKKLVEDKLVTATWLYGTLNISTANISAIQEISPAEENLAFLKVSTFSGETFNGVKLVKMGGRHYYYCPQHTANLAYVAKLPLSDESLEFATWRGSVHWDKIQLGTRKTYKQPFAVTVSSSITNFHN